MACIMVAATRSEGACCTALNGRTTIYAKLAAMYRPITMKVPRARDKGTFRLGLRTSPAAKVMLFQPSAAKRDPTCAIQSAAIIPIAVKGEGT
jgi:hypothetical protein